MELAAFPGKPTGTFGRPADPRQRKVLAYIFPLLVIASGFACHGIFTVVNFLQGMSIGYNEWSQAVFGSVSLAIDVLGVGVCSALAGRWRASGRRWQAKKVMFAVYLSAAYSLMMFYSYNAAERIEPTKQAEATVNAEQTAKERSERASADSRASYITNLMEQAKAAGALAFDTSLPKREREAAKTQQELYLKQAGESSFQPVEIEADPIAKSRDAGAAILASHLGWKVVSVQEAVGLASATILMMISILLIRHGFQILPVSGGHRMRPITVPAPVYDPLLKKSRGSPDLAADIERRLIKWINAATRPSPGNKVQAKYALKHFNLFERELGYEESTHARFGIAMRRLHKSGRIDFPKDHKNTPVFYLGRKLDWTLSWAVDHYPLSLDQPRSRNQPRPRGRPPKLPRPKLVAQNDRGLSATG